MANIQWNEFNAFVNHLGVRVRIFPQIVYGSMIINQLLFLAFWVTNFELKQLIFFESNSIKNFHFFHLQQIDASYWTISNIGHCTCVLFAARTVGQNCSIRRTTWSARFAVRLRCRRNWKGLYRKLASEFLRNINSGSRNMLLQDVTMKRIILVRLPCAVRCDA